MRIMIKVQIPVERGNRAIKDGTLPRVIGNFLEKHKPESAYFGLADGRRTMFAVIDMTETSQMPPIGEPFFFELDATIEVSPVMTAAELKAGLAQLP